MRHAVVQTEAASPSSLRCLRCGAAVEPTRHTRTTWIVGYYRLHGGRTAEATLLRGDDEAPLVYRRLVEPADVVACARCFPEPDVRRLWDSFGDLALAGR
jgi:hypothetical protein